MMLTEWQTFLLTQGARIEGGRVLDFGHPELEAKAVMTGHMVTDLSFLAVIKIIGADAATFLNGQFTSEMTQLADGHVQLSAWCNPKGQVIANFIVVRFGDEYFLLLPGEIKDGFINRLRKFILRSDVTLEDCSDSLSCIGYKHADGEQITGIEITRLLSNQKRAIRVNGLVMFHVPANWNRVIIFGPPAALEVAWLNLVQIYSRIGSQYWQLFDIYDGLPWITVETSETSLPQLLNLDLLQGLSYQKGCFPGQEIIARLHYRGKYTHRLFLARLGNAAKVKSGANIYTSERSQHIGTVINIAEHPDQGFYALVILEVNHGNPEQLRLESSSARFLQISTPPYLTLP